MYCLRLTKIDRIKKFISIREKTNYLLNGESLIDLQTINPVYHIRMDFIKKSKMHTILIS